MDIKGYTKYQIFPDGRVWNKQRKRYVKPFRFDGDRYYRVNLAENDKRKRLFIHKLIAEYYIPNPKGYKTVAHINKDPTDNRIENLYWTTHITALQDKRKCKHNTSGHTCVFYNKKKDTWIYVKSIYGKTYRSKSLKTKIDSLCYKFIFELKRRTRKFKIENKLCLK